MKKFYLEARQNKVFCHLCFWLFMMFGVELSALCISWVLTGSIPSVDHIELLVTSLPLSWAVSRLWDMLMLPVILASMYPSTVGSNFTNKERVQTVLFAELASVIVGVSFGLPYAIVFWGTVMICIESVDGAIQLLSFRFRIKGVNSERKIKSNLFTPPIETQKLREVKHYEVSFFE